MRVWRRGACLYSHVASTEAYLCCWCLALGSEVEVWYWFSYTMGSGCWWGYRQPCTRDSLYINASAWSMKTHMQIVNLHTKTAYSRLFNFQYASSKWELNSVRKQCLAGSSIPYLVKISPFVGTCIGELRSRIHKDELQILWRILISKQRASLDLCVAARLCRNIASTTLSWYIIWQRKAL